MVLVCIGKGVVQSTTQSAFSYHTLLHTVCAFLAYRLCPCRQHITQCVILHTIQRADCAFFTCNPPHVVFIIKHYPHILCILCIQSQHISQCMFSQRTIHHTAYDFQAYTVPSVHAVSHDPQSGVSYQIVHHTAWHV